MNEKLESIVQKLEQERDELRVKMHLAKADARDEFDKLEDRWSALRLKMGVVKDGASEASGDVKEAASELADEIRKGYRNIMDRL